jgi:predicted molibdopterin-dependent oxidoreductase YjgC
VEDGLVVRTRTEQVDKIRKVLLEQMLAHAPDSEQINELADIYGADRDRFEKESNFCILCGLCVRYCAEIKQKNAISFFERGAKREIAFIPEIAVRECWDCKECFPLCPTSALQAAYVLTEALLTPPEPPGSCGGCKR